MQQAIHTPQWKSYNSILPLELLAEILQNLDPYSVLKARNTSRSFYNASNLIYPSGSLVKGLTIALWERIFSYLPQDIMEGGSFTSRGKGYNFKNLMETCKGFYCLIKHTKTRAIQQKVFMEPLSTQVAQSLRWNPAIFLFMLKLDQPDLNIFYQLWVKSPNDSFQGLVEPSTQIGLQYFENINVQLDLEHPVLRANATSPPTYQAIVHWAGWYYRQTRPVFVTSRGERAITVRDIFLAGVKLMQSKLEDVDEVMEKLLRRKYKRGKGPWRTTTFESFSIDEVLQKLLRISIEMDLSTNKSHENENSKRENFECKDTQLNAIREKNADRLSLFRTMKVHNGIPIFLLGFS
ncbi:hypothetical protein H072_9126 [Dactylellina haptotyla CBS 200.50]|uniref:F-box domain-containing protein n=1 Tax=Dactylellina haptotyla (strain CBS 200.50) TaxID=1284197 RepID=S8A2H2_DACHA|nr:hypothetical protein H072_9126 [Dactylellina haptotyla CBS 200.50]